MSGIFRPIWRLPPSTSGRSLLYASKPQFGKTLTAESGAFTLAGSNANLLRGYRLVADTVAFTVNGQPANLAHGYPLVAQSGSFNLTGNPVGLRVSRRLTADSGVFTLTGYNAGLSKFRTLIADSGSFNLTGNNVLLIRRRLVAQRAQFRSIVKGASIRRGSENIVSLATYGGGPGATPAANETAWNNAIGALNAAGGGTLVFPPGTYNLGNASASRVIFWASPFNNIKVMGQGVTLVANTTDMTSGHFFQLGSPNNSSVEGFTFNDTGAVITGPSANVGLQCFYIPVHANCSNFKLIDLKVERANIFVTFEPGAGNLTNTTIAGIYIKNAYYGVNAFSTGFGTSSASRSNWELTTEVCRRAVVSRGLSNVNITIRGIFQAAGAAANGFISPYTNDGIHSENVALNLRCEGDMSSYTSFQIGSGGGIVHLGHQGANTTTTNTARYRNWDINLDVDTESGTSPYLVSFSHLTSGYIATTAQNWDDIVITGTLKGAYNGEPIRVQTTSTGTPNSVQVSTQIRPNVSGFPSYFTSLASGRLFQADRGIFNLSAPNTRLLRGRRLVSDSGTFTLSGLTAGLNRGRIMPALGGSFNLTGYAANLVRNRRITADSGAFTLTGNAVTLARVRVLKAETGNFMFQFQPAIFRTGTGFMTVRGIGAGYKYAPEKPPENAELLEITQWALRELEKVSNVVNNVADGYVATNNAPPERPRNGMIRYADGTNWNPGGGGAGYYGFKEATQTWVKLG